MTQNLSIGIFGGTFDPVHLGHLYLAKKIIALVPMQHLLWIPCYQSPLKDLPVASAQDRFNMLQLATKDYPKFLIDDCELERGGLSYTLDTLRFLKQRYPEQSLIFIIGIDAFNHLDQWHAGEEILQLAHLVVVDRPGVGLTNNDQVLSLFDRHRASDVKELQKEAAGLIYMINIAPLPIAATQVRRLIASKHSASKLVAKEVWRYIEKHNLYR